MMTVSVCVSVCVCVCLFVHEHMSVTTRPQKSIVHVSYGHGSVLLCQYCDALYTSGFMHDIIFMLNGHIYCSGAIGNSQPA